MSADYALALRVTQIYEILGKIRAVAAVAAGELADASDKVKPETTDLLKAHYDHLLAVAKDLLIPSNLGRHISFAMRQDMEDIANYDVPALEAGIRAKIKALATGVDVPKSGFDGLLEEKIRSASMELYTGGYYKAAVLAGCDVIVGELRALTGLKLDGVDLVNQAFSAKAPFLTWREGEDKTSQNVRVGYTDLMRGAMAAIRNVYTHGGDVTFGALTAARHLVLLSTLLYRLKSAKKVGASG